MEPTFIYSFCGYVAQICIEKNLKESFCDTAYDLSVDYLGGKKFIIIVRKLEPVCPAPANR